MLVNNLRVFLWFNSINLRNSVESLGYEGRFLHVVVAMHLSVNWDMGSWSYPHGILVIFFQEVKSGCACLFWRFAKFKPCLF